MAFTIQSVTPDTYDPTLDFLSDFALMARALGGDQKAAARCVYDGADFLIQCRTTAAETGAAIELMTARLVPFPAAFIRLIEIDFYVSGNAADETGWARHTALVSGGTTPIVRVVTVPASTPVQVGGNTLTGVAGAGFTATPATTVVAGAGTVTVNVVSAEAEILNWTVRVRVGKLVPMILGV